MSIQHHKFHDGGYVLHKIEFQGRKFSAWYTSTGELIDAELVMASGETRRVHTRYIVIRAHLTKVGQRYLGV